MFSEIRQNFLDEIKVKISQFGAYSYPVLPFYDRPENIPTNGNLCQKHHAGLWERKKRKTPSPCHNQIWSPC